MTDLHTVFFRCLQTSPSYLLAHRITAGEVQREGAELVPGFEEVERTYGLCGSVYLMDFEDWWSARGSKAFESGALTLRKLRMKPPTMQRHLLAVQFWAVVRLLKMRGRKSVDPNANTSAITRAQLLMKLGTGMPHLDEAPSAEKRAVMKDPARKKSLGNTFDGRLQQGFRLVENAARGRFPSDDALPKGLRPSSQNREEIGRVLRDELNAFVGRWEREHAAEYPNVPFSVRDDTWEAADILLYHGLTPDDVKGTLLEVSAAHWTRVLADKARVARLKDRATEEERLRMRGGIAAAKE